MYYIGHTKEGYARRSKRVHNRGAAPCGACNTNHHSNCRLRQDRTLCSCSCEKATALREDVKRAGAEAEAKGLPAPTPVGVVLAKLNTKYEKTYGTTKKLSGGAKKLLDRLSLSVVY